MFDRSTCAKHTLGKNPLQLGYDSENETTTQRQTNMELWYNPTELNEVQELIHRWDKLDMSSSDELRRALLFIHSQPELRVVSDMLNQLTTNLEYVAQEEEVVVEQEEEFTELSICESTDLDLYEEEEEAEKQCDEDQ